MPETSNQKEILRNSGRNTTQPNTTQIRTQEEKMNEVIIKRIMSEKKTVLSSIWNQDWKTVWAETKKQKAKQKNPNNITKLNYLIYAGAKLV